MNMFSLNRAPCFCTFCVWILAVLQFMWLEHLLYDLAELEIRRDTHISRILQHCIQLYITYSCSCFVNQQQFCEVYPLVSRPFPHVSEVNICAAQFKVFCLGWSFQKGIFCIPHWILICFAFFSFLHTSRRKPFSISWSGQHCGLFSMPTARN